MSQRSNEAGTKYDGDKPMIDLVEPDFIIEIAKNLTYGCKKYGANNWKKGLSQDRTYAAAQRHLLAWKKGELIDQESGTPHLIAAATEIMFTYWAQQQQADKIEDARAYSTVYVNEAKQEAEDKEPAIHTYGPYGTRCPKCEWQDKHKAGGQ